MDESFTKLGERIECLESRQSELQSTNRKLRTLTGAMLFVGGALSLMGLTAVAQPQTLEAEQFVLRGNDGKVRGAMGITPDGSVGFNLTDVKGQTRVTLDLASDGSPGLDLYDAQG